jgi:hypothetical protein
MFDLKYVEKLWKRLEEANQEIGRLRAELEQAKKETGKR